MAKYPGAAWRPLGEQTEPKMTRPDVVCLHTMVGYLSSTDAMFKQKGYTGTESHFGVGGVWGKADVAQQLDGVVYQWQDTRYQADANGMGNDRLISIETADNAPRLPRDLAPWTPRQVDALIDLVVWCCRTHDIPPVLIPDTRPGRRGIGYHRQGCDPWRVTGGELWSDAYGKECPGPARIEQIRTIIVPAVAAALAPVDPPPPVVHPEEITMLVLKADDTGRYYLAFGNGTARYIDNPATLNALRARVGMVTIPKESDLRELWAVQAAGGAQ